MASALASEYGEDVAVSFIKDEGATGNFEVKIDNDGTLIHSKKAGGDRCESSATTQVPNMLPLLCVERKATVQYSLFVFFVTGGAGQGEGLP